MHAPLTRIEVNLEHFDKVDFGKDKLTIDNVFIIHRLI